MSLGVLHNATTDLIYYVEESLLPPHEQMLLCLINYTVVTQRHATPTTPLVVTETFESKISNKNVAN